MWDLEGFVPLSKDLTAKSMETDRILENLSWEIASIYMEITHPDAVIVNLDKAILESRAGSE